MVRVSTKQGELNGKLVTLPSGNTYASFKGVPYAKPPINELRYKAPEPPVKWTGVRDALEHGSCCTQFQLDTKQVISGSEDCLFLNVYTPNIKGNFPVMVWFHGGGFLWGSGDSDMYGPDYLIEENVILVTVNYRLEVLGFICLDTKEVPGNAGLKDQVMALRWVQENISNFGGDSNNVTIFGESAGGASVTYHMISPMSKGLFHKVISQSGCVLNEWAMAFDNLDRAFRLGIYFGKDTNDVNELLTFLRSVHRDKLTKVTYRVLTSEEKKRGLPIFFGPVIEKSFKGQEAFLDKSPIEILLSGNYNRVPIMVGYNNGEGIVFIKEVNKKAERIEKDMTLKLPRAIVKSVPEEYAKMLAKRLIEFYYKGKKINDESAQATVDMESDYKFTYDILNFTKFCAKFMPNSTYLYRFSADTKLNFTKNLIGYEHVKGACHADDLFYIFKTWLDIEEGSDEWKAAKNVITLWTNFAKYGNPTPSNDNRLSIKWKSVIENEINFLDIDVELTPGTNPENERYEFWRQMYSDVKKITEIKSAL